MTELDNKAVYVVLGATGGIGAELCSVLASGGARLVMGARKSEKLEKLAIELDSYSYPLDATQTDQVEACVEKAVELYGRVDGIANCVGSLLLKPAHHTNEVEWDSILQTNLTSAFAAVKAAGKFMRKTGGSVVLMSSAAARIGLPNHEAIAAAKAGVIGLVLSAAATYARHHIRFNCVAPGLVRTSLSAPITGSETASKVSLSMHALGRFGEPSDVAAGIAWLLDLRQSWVTGQVFGIDGGLGTVRTWDS